MKPQDIFNQIKNQAEAQEQQPFDAKERVWDKIECKLEKKEKKRTLWLWKPLAIAASVALIVGAAFLFFQQKNEIAEPNPTIVNTPTTKEEVKNNNENGIRNTETQKEEIDNSEQETQIATEKEEEEEEVQPKELVKDRILNELEKTVVAVQEPILKNREGFFSESKTSSRDLLNSVKKSEDDILYESTISTDINLDLSQNNILEEDKAETAASTIISTTDFEEQMRLGNSINPQISYDNLVQNQVSEIDSMPQDIFSELEKNTIAYQNVVVPKNPLDELRIKNSAQSVTGIVVDDFGPIFGAIIIVDETGISTESNDDGTFKIQAKIGQNLTVTNPNTLADTTLPITQLNMGELYLSDVSMELNSTIAVGYRKITEKGQTSSAVSVVDSEEINNVAIGNVSQILQGRVSGVRVNVGSGQPGSDPNVTIRGVGSSNASSLSPLYVVDGLPVNSGFLKQLNPNNIQSMSILKDASATALYGSRGNNGVIIIETNLSKKEKRKLKKLLKKQQKAEQDTLLPFQLDVSNESYEEFIENPFVAPSAEPLSTFSIDVDNASYSNIRRFINMGQTVPKDAVRIEEMINYFDYDYAQPKGNEPLAIHTEYSSAPWNPNHKLLKIGLQAQKVETENLPASNLVFLIDVSGSMSDANKLPLLKSSIKLLVEELRPEDKVSIVVYAGAAGLVLEPTSGNEKQKIINALDKLEAGGSTAGGEGIELAYRKAQEHFVKDGNNRIIMATDGDFNVGASSNQEMEDLIEEKRKSGVFLTVLGYGMGNYKDDKMELLADKGNGNYAYIDNLQEANKFLVREFGGTIFTIAKDVKIQIEFNPAHVAAYRLIGYENRRLRPEDFKNDAIDAGEMGSGHTVTALYEIIPKGAESNYFVSPDELKYAENTNAQGVFNNELGTIKFRYKNPNEDKSKELVEVVSTQVQSIENTSDNFKFASAVAWFGLKLRDSNLVPNKSSLDIKKLAKDGKGKDEEGYRAEFIRLVDMVK